MQNLNIKNIWILKKIWDTFFSWPINHSLYHMPSHHRKVVTMLIVCCCTGINKSICQTGEWASLCCSIRNSSFHLPNAVIHYWWATWGHLGVPGDDMQMPHRCPVDAFTQWRNSGASAGHLRGIWGAWGSLGMICRYSSKRNSRLNSLKEISRCPKDYNSM